MKFTIEKEKLLDGQIHYDVRVCEPFNGWVWIGTTPTRPLAQSLIREYRTQQTKKKGYSCNNKKIYIQ